jgi:transposase
MNTQAQRRPDLEGVAALAMKLGGRHLADYGATRSRHDFTQRQLMSCLILRAYLKTTYRGVLEHLKNCPALRRELGLADKLPHYSTLQKFSARSRVLEIADKLIQSIAQAAAAVAPEGETAAMDATGLELTSASTYYQTKCGKRRHQWVKLSAIVLCGSLLPLSISLDWGPSSDLCQVPALISKAKQAATPAKLYADRGYDAESTHELIRRDWGVESVIRPNLRRSGAIRTGYWRPQMTEQYLKKAGYNKRWTVESFFSALKRTMGSMLSARRPDQLLAEAALKVLAYTLRR